MDIITLGELKVCVEIDRVMTRLSAPRRVVVLCSCIRSSLLGKCCSGRGMRPRSPNW